MISVCSKVEFLKINTCFVTIHPSFKLEFLSEPINPLARKRSNSWNYSANPATNLMRVPDAPNSIERSASFECVNVSGILSPNPVSHDRYPSWEKESHCNYQIPTPNNELPPSNPLFSRMRDNYSSPFNSKSLPSNFRNLTLKEISDRMSEASSVSEFGSQEYLGSNMYGSKYEEMGVDQDIKLFQPRLSEDNDIVEEILKTSVNDYEQYMLSHNTPLCPYEWSNDGVAVFVAWCNQQFQLNIAFKRFVGYNGAGLCQLESHQLFELLALESPSRGQIMHQMLEFLKKNYKPSETLHRNSEWLLQHSDNVMNITNPNSNMRTPPTLVISDNNEPPPSPAKLIPHCTHDNLLHPDRFIINHPARQNLFLNCFNHISSQDMLCGSPISPSPISTPLSTPGQSPQASPHHSPCPSPTLHSLSSHSSPTGCGPIQLWQFLLELLLDPKCHTFIHWTDKEWEFKLVNPEEVAKKWGQRKNKPKMNYEKLSRGLRYYYDKNIIHKVPGKRYVYRFVCDVQRHVGCSFEELILKLKGEAEISHSPVHSQPLSSLEPAFTFTPDHHFISRSPKAFCPSPTLFSPSPGSISPSPTAFPSSPTMFPISPITHSTLHIQEPMMANLSLSPIRSPNSINHTMFNPALGFHFQ